MAENVIPVISVLMPVYNAGSYLRDAIQSILDQSYKDFELIVLNDGSTDSSEEIIKSFSDPRIRYMINERNLGIVATLNRGIDLARGAYIARMDGDDLSLPNRFEIQLKYFESETEAAVVCSPAYCITPAGNPAADWDADIMARTSQQIRSTLAKENCIAHPSVLIRAGILKKYRYREAQKGSEDWDLWMRIVADGLKIIKTKERLLKYRIHFQSTTSLHNASASVERKIIRVRKRFLSHRIGKLRFGAFELKVFYALLRSIARNWKINIVPSFLRNCKRLLTQNPFKAAKQFRSLKEALARNTEVDLWFFFPYCHVGGAERVHANIAEVFSDKRIMIIFTGISGRDDFFYMFEKSGPSVNAGLCINHPFYGSRSGKLIFESISAQKQTAVFGVNNLFFYGMVPRLKKSVRVFDLMHDFRFDEPDISHSFFPQYARCEKRIFISNRALGNMKQFYKSMNADPELYDRLELITNYVKVPAEIPQKDFSGKIKVLYVGRDTPEKRAQLFGRLAKECHKESTQFEFTAIGDLSSVISAEDGISLTGPLLQFEEIEKYYRSFHVIVITSEREGFPMAIMEGMAYGMVPLSSPVGDVPLHIQGNCGFVTSAIEENKMISEMKSFLLSLENNRNGIREMSGCSYTCAKQNFSRDKFFHRYKEVVNV